MKPYSTDEKTKVIRLYIETKSIVGTQRKYRRFLKTRKAPSRNVILSLVEKFLAHGSVENLRKGRCGRKKTKRTPDNVEKTQKALQRSPNKSLRRLSQELGCSKTTAQRLARTDCQLFPYKVSVHQTLTESDKQARMLYSGWFLRNCDDDSDFLHQIWFTDEANFHLDGRVNSQNFRFWSTDLPDVVAEAPLHSAKCTAFCAISSRGVIGPFWFEDSAGATVTVNAQRYRKVISRFWTALRRKMGGATQQLDSQWFQQDGATAHTAGATRKWLRDRFGQRLISRGEVHSWPARSPDLTPCDFFLWGHRKDQVHMNNPGTLQELKEAVTCAVRRVRREICRAALESARSRAVLCLERKGEHLEHVLCRHQ